MRFEQGKPLVVQVIRGLVQQQDVRLGQQYRPKAESCLLAAGQLACVPAQKVIAKAKLRGHPGHALRQVGTAQRQPSLEGGVVGIIGACGAAGQGPDRSVELSLRG